MTADYTITFANPAVAVRLSSAFGTSGAPQWTAKYLSLQADGSNAAVIYLAGSNHGAAVSSSIWGQRIEAASAGVPPAPTIFELSHGLLSLSEFWAIGAAGEKLHLFLKD